MTSSRLLLSLFALASQLIVACGRSEAKSPYAEQVPANSASEARLNIEKTESLGQAALPAQSATPVGRSRGVHGGAAKADSNPKPTAARDNATGKVSKAECSKLFDKYIDLEIGQNSMFAGIAPEDLAQLKAQTRAQASAEKGDPCSTNDISRAAYECAMAARTTQAWQACMK